MTVQLAPRPVFKGWDNNGNVLAGGQLFTYQAGTTTPQASWVDATQTTQNTNPVILNARGEANVWLDPTLAYKLVLQDSLGNQIWAVDSVTGQALTQAVIGGILYPRSAAEVAAGITPVNFQYPYLYPERYGTNSTPGMTDMTAAVNAAFAVAKISGGIINLNTSGQYLVTAPINCTTVPPGSNAPAVLVQGTSGLDLAVTGVLAVHNGVAVFDCTGNDSITFRDVTIRTPSPPPGGVFPQTGWLFARDTTGGSLLNKLFNCKAMGFFSVCCYYNFGSENSVTEACYFWNLNTAANCCTRVYTASNVFGLVSPFTTINAGTVSCIGHDDIASADQMGDPTHTASATSDCVRLEGVSTYGRVGGWMDNQGGRAYIYVDQSRGSTSSFCRINGLLTEQNGNLPLYGIYFSSTAVSLTPVGWALTNSYILTHHPSGAVVTAADVNTTVSGLYYTNVGELNSHGIILPGTLNSYSFITSPTVVNVGTFADSVLVGLSSNWTITTKSGNNVLLDQTAITGYGTPTGGSHQSSFAAGSITLPNLAAAVAQLIIDLKAKGLIQA